MSGLVPSEPDAWSAFAVLGVRRQNTTVGGPDFVLVGAARSGTTTMYGWLQRHPDVFMTRVKEPGYFVDGFGVNDPLEYRSLFVPAYGRIAGEATTMYLASPESPGRIRSEVGDVPILILLRDPVARAFSLHTWMHQNGWEPIGDFEAALAAEPERAAHPESLAGYRQCLCDYLYFGSGLYSSQIMAYQERFSSVKVLLLDDLEAAPQDTFDGVCDFLGVRRAPVSKTGRTNIGKRPRWPKIQLTVRRGILRCDDHGSPPARVGKVLLWRLNDLNVRLGRRASIRPATEEILRRRYAEDVERTGKVIERDLSGWLPAARVGTLSPTDQS
jgi:hypothetical protein